MKFSTFHWNPIIINLKILTTESLITDEISKLHVFFGTLKCLNAFRKILCDIHNNMHVSQCEVHLYTSIVLWELQRKINKKQHKWQNTQTIIYIWLAMAINLLNIKWKILIKYSLALCYIKEPSNYISSFISRKYKNFKQNVPDFSVPFFFWSD